MIAGCISGSELGTVHYYFDDWDELFKFLKKNLPLFKLYGYNYLQFGEEKDT